MHPRKAGALSQFSNRVALITGGSRSIGAATVRVLAAAGWDITFCHDRDDRAAVEVEKAALELGARVLAVQADLTRPAEAIAWVQRAEEELGPVQAAVSCAGITMDRPLALLEAADWRALTDTGLLGVLHLCQAVLPAMMARQSGRIVAVSSVSGVYGDVPADKAIPARAGIAAFTAALASQTRRYGIRANAIAPAACSPRSMADMVSIWPPRPAAAAQPARPAEPGSPAQPARPAEPGSPGEPASPAGTRPPLTEAIAVRRFASAAAVAERVAFLLSEAAAGLTGTLLEVPGGI